MSSLCQILLDRSVATLSQVDAVLAAQAHRGGSVGAELLARDVLAEAELHDLLGELHELPAGPAGEPLSVDAAANALFSATMACHLRVIPLERRDGHLWVATSIPLSEDNERRIVAQVNMPICCVVVSELRIQQALALHFEGPALHRRDAALLAKLDGDDVALDEAPPSSSGAVSSRPAAPSSDGSFPGDWLPSGSRTSGPGSAPPSSSQRGGDDSSHFRHRGPLARKDGERALERASDVRFAIEVLVRYARQFVDRCVLFVVRRGVATPRHAHGWEMAPLRVDLSEPGVLGEASRRGAGGITSLGFDGSDLELRARIGLGDHRVIVVPLAIRGRTVAVLLGADDGADVESEAAQELDTFSYEVATALARIIVENKRGS